MITPEGLEDQMLNIVVKIEEPNKVPLLILGRAKAEEHQGLLRKQE
jgi:hypothetical protein